MSTSAEIATVRRSAVTEAAGWLEADPFPIYVPALAPGIVKEVLVLEGEPVEAGQVVVRMIDDDARLVKEEPFGPILPVLKFSDVEDALRRANDSSCGLGGSVWSSDVDAATLLASRLECGTAWVNNHAMIQPDAPFGGVKESGIGVEFGRYGLEEYTNIQTLQISKS